MKPHIETILCESGPHDKLRFNVLGSHVGAVENVHGFQYSDTGRRDPETGDSIFSFVGKIEYQRPRVRTTQGKRFKPTIEV